METGKNWRMENENERGSGKLGTNSAFDNKWMKIFEIMRIFTEYVLES